MRQKAKQARQHPPDSARLKTPGAPAAGASAAASAASPARSGGVHTPAPGAKYSDPLGWNPLRDCLNAATELRLGYDHGSRRWTIHRTDTGEYLLSYRSVGLAHRDLENLEFELSSHSASFGPETEIWRRPDHA